MYAVVVAPAAPAAAAAAAATAATEFSPFLVLTDRLPDQGCCRK